MLTTSQPDVVRAARDAATNAAKADAEQASRVAPLVTMMSTAAGRAFVWKEMLSPLRATISRGDTSNRWDASAVAYAIGGHDAALSLMQKLEDACPELVVAMTREALAKNKGESK